MYSYIVGKVTEISAKSITCEVNNIGYQVFVSNPFSFESNQQKVYLYQNVREDEITLYGFKREEDKHMFLDLISVKGIGPKTALAILAVDDVIYIQNAIVREDVNYLQKFPKIGKKAAQQIIIDLSGKYDINKKNNDSQLSVVNNDEEVIEALVSLGYSQKDVQKNLKSISQELSTEDKIKEVLKSMIS